MISGGFLKQTQRQKLIQKLSPQQIQLMKLLQVPTASLEDRIREELENNPALETGKSESESNEEEMPLLQNEGAAQEQNDFQDEETDSTEDYLQTDLSEYLQDDQDFSEKYRTSDDYDEPKETPVSLAKVEKTFHDYLEDQLGLLNLSQRQKKIARQIIGSIDDDGYLRRDPVSIVDDLAFNQNLIIEESEVKEIITKIQEFDPPGVAAQDLQECLLLQLNRMPDSNTARSTAFQIINDHFDSFTKKHYNKIKERLKIPEEVFKSAVDLILKLTPKPGISFSTAEENSNYIIPDFFVLNNNGNLELTLNARNAPELHISEGYREMFKSFHANKRKNKKEREALLFIKQKVDAAKWFIDAIKQRQQTLLLTMQAILTYQQQFFLSGDESDLRPMILKDIAESIEMDISTVSRVANSKYVQTEFGIYLLKYFFSEAMSTESGEEVSTREIKKILREIVDAENKKSPYSDEKLMKLLAEEGYVVARRTVAKYREQLEIPVARLRKEV